MFKTFVYTERSIADSASECGVIALGKPGPCFAVTETASHALRNICERLKLIPTSDLTEIDQIDGLGIRTEARTGIRRLYVSESHMWISYRCKFFLE